RNGVHRVAAGGAIKNKRPRCGSGPRPRLECANMEAQQITRRAGARQPKPKLEISAGDLSRELSQRADDIARPFLGPPNRKQSTKRELRWGRHGSLRVRIAGPKRGKWQDFERCQRGDLLDLIRREQGCTLREACDYACNLLGPPRGKDTAKVRSKPKP